MTSTRDLVSPPPAGDPAAASPALLLDVLLASAERDPAAPAFTFLTFRGDGARPDAAVLSRSELDTTARALAVELLASVPARSRVLVLLPPGLDFTAGLAACCYAGLTAVPCPPPADAGDAPGLERAVATARDAEAGAVLAATQAPPPGWAEAGGPAGLPWLAAGAARTERARDWQRPDVAGTDLALLQYTSGSTGAPKAVAVSQASLAEQLALFRDAQGLPPGTNVVTWISVFHALGLAGHLLLSQYLGGACTFMTPEDFIADPARWLEAISATPGPVLSCAPNFAFDRCVDHVGPDQRAHLDLSGWHTALNAAERIRPQTLDRFAAAFGPCGFSPRTMFPAYGLTEVMLMVSGRHGPDPLVLEIDAAELEHGRVRPARPGAPSRELVGNGPPGRGQRVLVVDPDTRCPRGEDEVGEIWISGPIVTQGYWRRPAETARVFGARLADDAGGPDAGLPFLRTGDLGFFHHGELVLCGRRKELIIIRGRNLYPQDIETTGQRADPGLAGRPAAAFSVDSGDGERLVVVQAVDPAAAGLDQLARAVRTAVTDEHAVEAEVVLTAAGDIPMTASGKVRRAACRQAYLDGALGALATSRDHAGPGPRAAGDPGPAPLGDILRGLDEDLRGAVAAAELRRRLAACLGAEPGSLPEETPLAGLGLESLRAIELSAALGRECRADLPVSDFLRGSIRGLAARLAAAAAREPAGPPDPQSDAAPAARLAADPATRHEPFPLTPLQQAYFVGRASSFALGGTSIHFYAEFDRPDLDPARLRQALDRLVRRQEMLRAVITEDGRQRIRPAAEVPEVPLPVTDLSAAGDADAERELTRIRDELSHQVIPPGQWPMFEVRATRLPGQPGGWRTHVSLDLLVADVASVRLFFQEWGDFYADPQRPAEPPGVSFRDCVMAALAAPEPGDAERERAWAYWRSRLDTLPPGPDLPRARQAAMAGSDESDNSKKLSAADNSKKLSQPDNSKKRDAADNSKKRGAATGLARRRRADLLPADSWNELRQRAAAHGLTPSAVLLGVYATVLARWSDSGHFTVNVPLFNRPAVHPDIDQVIGDFTTVTLLECRVRPDQAFPALAQALQEQLWADLEHRAVSGLEVISEIARQRGVRADTFAPVVFASAREQGRDQGGAGGPLGARWLGDTVHAVSQTPQVLLDFQAYEDDGGLSFNWDAVDGAFPPGVLDDMFGACRDLLLRLAGDDRAWQAEGPDPLPARHRAIIDASNDTGPGETGYLFSGIAEQARAHPGRTAVIGPDRTLTFGEWYGHACRIGARLREAGVRPGELVAVAADKSAAQLVAVLAVHLAGGAYVPVDPGLPPARQDLMLARSQARLVLTRAGGPERGWPAGITPVPVDLDQPARGPALEPVQSPADLAYVLYTSGSSGTPKGVMISHQAALNTVAEVARLTGAGPDDRVLGLSSLSFDLSVWDVFGVPGAGGATVLPGPGAERDPGRWLELMSEHRVTLWNSVPALLDMLTEYAPDGHPALAALRLAWLSGDWIPLSLPGRLARCAPGTRLIASGGPTETSIWSVWYPVDELDPGWDSVPYGRPLRGHQIHVLNDRGQPCPLWVPGEMHISGAGVADGYWRDEQRTAEAFVTRPGDGQRCYRSGDYGRWLPDGNLEILGRRDGQVKLGGYRIELGEIEAALGRQPGVRAAAVVVADDGQLAAFVVPHAPAADGPPAQTSGQPSSQTPGSGAKAALGEVITDPVQRLEFLVRRPGRRTDLDQPAVPLPGHDPGLSSAAGQRPRASCRAFGRAPLPLDNLAALLEPLRDIPADPFPRHHYGSAGSLYPVQAYLYAKPDRIAGLEAGSYYYDPRDHCLRPVRPGGQLAAGSHVEDNRALFEAAAFQVFLVGRGAAIEPLYGHRARDFSLLEAGLMTQLLEGAATGAGLGLCQLGLLRDHQQIRDLLRLDDGDEILHGLVGGLREARTADDTGDGTGDLAARLRAGLAAELPAYLMPGRITILDRLPLSGRDKVDRAALARSSAAAGPAGPPDPAVAAPGERDERGEVEEAIRRVITEVTGRPPAAADTNFADLGATSVQIVRAHRELQAALGRPFPLILMFEQTTVRRLAEALAGDAAPASGAVTAEFDRARRRRGRTERRST